MKDITRQMIKIYHLSEFDFMGYKLEKNPTFHHLKKSEFGGKYEISNGAVLNKISHQYLHIIEYKEIELYMLLNKLLKISNENKEVTIENLKAIDYLLNIFEEEYKRSYNSKGKELIKNEYTKRLYRNK